MVVNSSRKSSTQRCTTQKRQKSVVVKLRIRARQQADGVEGRNGKRGEEEQPRHVALVLRAPAPAQSAEQHHHPEHQPDGQQDLPEPAEIEILESLAPNQLQPRSNPAVDPGIFAGQAAEHDDRQRAEQPVGKPAAGRAARGRRSSAQERSRGQKGSGNPEDRQLQVPGARHVEGQHAGQVEARKSSTSSAR